MKTFRLVKYLTLDNKDNRRKAVSPDKSQLEKKGGGGLILVTSLNSTPKFKIPQATSNC